MKGMANTIAVIVLFGAALAYLAVQRRKAARRLSEEKAKSDSLLKRLQADLDHAARIQRDFLPKADPRIEGYDVAGINVPCYEIGGDYFDFIRIAPNRLGIVIADVSGKGISASLLMASLRAALLAEVRSGHSPDQLAARLSDFVHDSSGPSSFVTFFFAELDLGTGELRYVNAGHNPPFVLALDGATRALESSGFPLGMFAGSPYQAGVAHLAPGELAVLFTDGIPEGRNARGEDYSDARLSALVRENRSLGAAEICSKVLADVQDYACGIQACDDITLVVIKRNGDSYK
jgi:sigma-B regulation protein RsbU (phosphoserine phosphatase)